MKLRRTAVGLSLAALLVVTGSCTKDPATTTEGQGHRETATTNPSGTAPSDNKGDKSGDGKGSGHKPLTPPNTADKEALSGTKPVKPVDVGADSPLMPDVLLQITKVDHLKLTGRGPGDSTGPGIAVYVKLTNNSDHKVDFSTLSVVAQQADGDPLLPSRSKPAAVPTGDVAPGDESVAVWTFHASGDLAGSLIQATHPQSPSIVQFKL